MEERNAVALVQTLESSDWSILTELGRLEEDERRETLRWHHSGPHDETRRLFHHRLNGALDRLTRMELAAELGLIKEFDAQQCFAGIPQLARLLSESNAFVRYADNRLALSLRFVAERLKVPMPDSADELNELPTARPYPPALATERDRSAVFFTALPAFDSTTFDVAAALAFLDIDADPVAGDEPTRTKELTSGAQAARDHTVFGLWLRGLSGIPPDDAHFLRVARGLVALARGRSTFYEAMEAQAGAMAATQPDDSRRFVARVPITARFGVQDLYWLARLLKADVSPTGNVTYANGSWLTLLARRAPAIPLEEDADTLEHFDAVIRGVVDYACDLIQNAVDIVDAFLADDAAREESLRPPESLGWRAVFDEELQEIGAQRDLRHQGSLRATLREQPDNTHIGMSQPSGTGAVPPVDDGNAGVRPRADGRGRVGWSRRIRTGEQEPELVGLALSGGGIRSATFALGILQHLQKLDLLRKLDYISTVSGGGYIGSWLVANALRTRYWLTRPTDWSPSIGHLRRYSNYLSPQVGLFSADTWTMWGTWIRNTFLIQLSAVAYLALALTLMILGRFAFGLNALNHTTIGQADIWYIPPMIFGHSLTHGDALSGGVLVAMLWLSICSFLNLQRERPSRSENSVQTEIALPALAASLLSAAALWAAPRPADTDYGALLLHQAAEWWPALAAMGICFFALALRSIEQVPPLGAVLLSLLTAAVAVTGTYLGACATFWAFWQWRSLPDDAAVWHAFTLGPSLLLLSTTIGVALMIGVLGPSSTDWRREWWTRLGAWLGIYAVVPLVLASAATYGPWLVLTAFERAGSTPGLTTGGVLTWLGTIVGGLLAGNNTRADSEEVKDSRARAVALFAEFAAVVFIASTLCLVATLVHVILFNMSADGEVAGGQNYWRNMALLKPVPAVLFLAGSAAVAGIASARFDLNIFGLNQFYRNRLVRCFLGATRWQPGKRSPHAFTAFDGGDEVDLSELRVQAPEQRQGTRASRRPQKPHLPYSGPFPIINGALNLGGSSDLSLHTRHSASFTMTPLRCGADRQAVGYAPTESTFGRFADGVTLGQAVSISGAAASPNMGYDTSPLVSFLLTMFNVRLGWWFPNPGRNQWNGNRLTKGTGRLLAETFGMADEKSRFVNVSDGGHFENLGIYELVRRRCTVIIASDSECDSDMAFGSLGRVIRMCRSDFDADIDIDVESIRRTTATGVSRAHCAVGRITYANGSRGYLVYLKSSVTGDEELDVQQYYTSHPEFPHESTADQFFAEDQFESYRKLGEHVAAVTFRGVENLPSVTSMACRLAEIWAPDSSTSTEFVGSTTSLVAAWERMRTTPGLGYLFQALHGLPVTAATLNQRSQDDERVACLELIQLLENTYVGLHLDEHWTHPDNQGWVELFSLWARCAPFRQSWKTHRHLFGTRFGYFCRQRLGLA